MLLHYLGKSKARIRTIGDKNETFSWHAHNLPVRMTKDDPAARQLHSQRRCYQCYDKRSATTACIHQRPSYLVVDQIEVRLFGGHRPGRMKGLLPARNVVGLVLRAQCVGC